MRLRGRLDDEIRCGHEGVEVEEGRRRLERGEECLGALAPARGGAGQHEAGQAAVDGAAHLPADRAETDDADPDRIARGTHRGAWYHAAS